jgi:large subunit ribosomal protein L24
MNKNKLHIKKGDTVLVLTGDSKGQKGRVLSVDTEKQRAIVEGINMLSKHTKPSNKNPQGGIIKQEGPIHISNLAVVDSKGNATRIGRRQEDGKSIRYSKKSPTGEAIK